MLDVFKHGYRQFLLLIFFADPDRIGANYLILRSINQLYLLDTGCQACHLSEVQLDSSDKEVEVALCECQLDPLYVIWVDLESVDNLEHKEEGRRWTVSFLVLLLCQLPVSHDIPDNLILIQGRFFKFFILEVDDLEEPEHVRFESFAVDAQFSDDSFLYV